MARISEKPLQRYIMLVPPESVPPSARPWLLSKSEVPGWVARLSIAWERTWRWEFWPAWLYYLPIIVWILVLGLRHRSLTVFTAANPGLDNGGVVGERKHQALNPLQRNAPELCATFVLLPEGSIDARVDAALNFAERVSLPIVLKPDVGQRGRGVFIARQTDDVRDYLSRFTGPVIAQRYITGEEFGVFIARGLSDDKARVISIVHKTFPMVIGDGVSNLRKLILADARARLIAKLLFARWAEELECIPAKGEKRVLVEIGSHCRGSLFLNATALASPALIETLTRLSDAVPGYRFGRIDLRVPSTEHLVRGEGLQVLELNGVTAESAHIYHPGTPLLVGYRAMFSQWALAFAIGKDQARRGATVTSALGLWRLWRQDLARNEQWF